MSFLYLLLIGLLFLFFISYLFSNRDILAPSVTMTIMYTIATMFAILSVSSWNVVDYSFTASTLSLTGIFTFICIEGLVRFFSRFKKNTALSSPTDFKAFRLSGGKLFLLVAINLSIVVWYFLQIRNLVGDESITATFQAYRRLGISNRSGEEVELVTGFIIQLLKVVEATGYVAGYMFINNWIATSNKCKWLSFSNLSLLLLILLSLMPGIFTAGRSKMLRMAAAFLIEYYILWHQKHGWNRNLSWKMIRIGLGSLIVGIPAFYYSLLLLGRNTTRQMFEYISVYIASGIVLFSEYIKNPVQRIMWGEESLYSVLKITNYLGLTPPSYSYNLEFRRLGDGYSNIYGFFRRPLHDFGLLGMYVFVALIACFFAYIYYYKINGVKRSSSTNRWTLIYAYFFYWIIASPMIQYSVAYLSVGTVQNLLIIMIVYMFLSEEGVNIKLKLS